MLHRPIGASDCNQRLPAPAEKRFIVTQKALRLSLLQRAAQQLIRLRKTIISMNRMLQHLIDVPVREPHFDLVRAIEMARLAAINAVSAADAETPQPPCECDSPCISAGECGPRGVL